MAGLQAVSLLFMWIIGLAIAGSVLGGLLGIAMPRLIVKRPNNIERGIGCVIGAVVGVIILFAISFFYLYITGAIYFPQDS
jgi:hypothetical protein